MTRPSTRSRCWALLLVLPLGLSAFWIVRTLSSGLAQPTRNGEETRNVAQHREPRPRKPGSSTVHEAPPPRERPAEKRRPLGTVLDELRELRVADKAKEADALRRRDAHVVTTEDARTLAAHLVRANVDPLGDVYVVDLRALTPRGAPRRAFVESVAGSLDGMIEGIGAAQRKKRIRRLYADLRSTSSAEFAASDLASFAGLLSSPPRKVEQPRIHLLHWIAAAEAGRYIPQLWTIVESPDHTHEVVAAAGYALALMGEDGVIGPLVDRMRDMSSRRDLTAALIAVAAIPDRERSWELVREIVITGRFAGRSGLFDAVLPRIVDQHKGAPRETLAWLKRHAEDESNFEARAAFARALNGVDRMLGSDAVEQARLVEWVEERLTNDGSSSRYEDTFSISAWGATYASLETNPQRAFDVTRDLLARDELRAGFVIANLRKVVDRVPEGTKRESVRAQALAVLRHALERGSLESTKHRVLASAKSLRAVELVPELRELAEHTSTPATVRAAAEKTLKELRDQLVAQPR